VSSIQPGKGVWVKVYGSGTLSLDGAAAAPKTGFPAADLTPTGPVNTIVFSDAAGKSRTLYLGEEGSGGEQQSLYELPPVPPAEAFDIRFGSQRYLEEYALRPGAETVPDYPVLIQGAQYPLTVEWSVASPVPDGRSMALTTTDGNKVYSVMTGSGALTFEEPPAGGIGVSFPSGVGLPAEFALSRNYPNPFNPVTRFSVELPREADVEVVVFDLLGRKINTLMDGRRPGGSYTVEWDGRDLNGLQMPTGIYLVRMNSGEFSEARKVMLMK